jgi:hypothetical protein
MILPCFSGCLIKKGVTAVSGDRIVPPPMDNGIKKHAFWNMVGLYQKISRGFAGRIGTVGVKRSLFT